jgi:UDP-glucose 4-epimerase
LLTLKCKNIAGEVFNIGTGVATSINQLANTLLEITNKRDLKIVHGEAREGDVRYSVADISEAAKKFGFMSRITLKNGLKRLLCSSRNI